MGGGIAGEVRWTGQDPDLPSHSIAWPQVDISVWPVCGDQCTSSEVCLGFCPGIQECQQRLTGDAHKLQLTTSIQVSI